MAVNDSKFNLYFVITRRRDSEGRLISGQWRGIRGWKNGVKGPVTKPKARQISGSVGAEIVPVEIDDVEEIVRRAFEKSGLPLPDELRDESDVEDVSDAADDVADTDGANSDEETEDTEDTEDVPEYPGYREAISLMSEHDFPWQEVGGGRSEGNVQDAWDEFVAQIKEAKSGE
jgi:hypothetical protein